MALAQAGVDADPQNKDIAEATGTGTQQISGLSPACFVMQHRSGDGELSLLINEESRNVITEVVPGEAFNLASQGAAFITKKGGDEGTMIPARFFFVSPGLYQLLFDAVVARYVEQGVGPDEVERETQAHRSYII